MTPAQYSTLFGDFDGYVSTLPPEGQASVAESLRWSQDPDADKQRMASVALVAESSGLDVEEVSQHFETDYMDRYALDPNGLGLADPPRDFGEFYTLAKQKVEDEKLTFDLATDAQNAATKQAMKGADYLSGFTAWQTANKAKPGYNQRAANAYREAFDVIGGKVEPYRGLIAETANALKERTGEAGKSAEGYDFSGLAVKVAAVPAEDQENVIKAIAATATKEGEDSRDFLTKLALSMDRGIEDMGSKVAGGVFDVFASPYEDAPQFFKDATVSKEDQAKIESGITKKRDLRILANKIRQVATGEVSPITSDSWFARGAYGAAQSAPMTAAAFVPYAGPAAMVAYFKEDTYLDLRANSPELTDAQAQAISTVAAPLQALTEVLSDRFLFGRLPSLKRALSAPVLSAKGILSQGASKLVQNVGVELAEENIQQLTAPALQSLAGALNADVPGTNWDGYLSRLDGEFQIEMIGQILPLALIGAGVATFDNVQHSRALAGSPLLLEAAGYTAERSVEISEAVKAGDTKTAEALMRSEWRELNASGESVGEVGTKAAQKAMAELRALEAKEVETRKAAMASLDSLGVTLPLRKVGNEWTLTMEAGKTAAFASHGEADAVRWENFKEKYLEPPAVQIREFIGQYEQAAETGREFVYEFDPQKMTGSRAVAEGMTTPEALARRLSQGDALTGETGTDASEFEAAIAAAAVTGADNGEVTGIILGRNRTEQMNGVLRSTMTLFSGHTPTTMVEELLETSANKLISAGRKQWMIDGLREWEAISGDKIFRDTDNLEDSDVIEAWSHFGQSYFASRQKGGDKASLPSWSDDNYRKSLKQIFNTRIGTAMNAMGVFLKSVFRRAAMISKARRDGKLSPELEQEIADQLGLGETLVHDREAFDEAKQMARESADDSGLNYVAPDDAPFSLIQQAPGYKETILPDGAKLIGPASFSIVAHHGTPHKVDRFSNDKIGTGEGAQAYGWGLYYAQNRNVAERYARNLTPELTVKGKPTLLAREVHGLHAAMDSMADLQFILHQVKAGTFTVESRPLIDRAMKRLDDATASASPGSATYVAAEKVADWWSSIGDPSTLRPQDIEQGFGNLYTVELLPDEDEFLDWDKPLSEQSEKVKAALGKMGIYSASWGETKYDAEKGEYAYQQAVNSAAAGGESSMWPKRGSDWLAKNGIPGIRYLDGGSRNQNLKIIPASESVSGKWVVKDGHADAGKKFDSEEEAKQYYEAELSKQSRNYVLFDESLVRILEENGKPVESNFSTINGPLSDQLAALFDPFQKNPEARARLALNMQHKAAAMGREWQATSDQQVKLNEIEARRKLMQAAIEEENMLKLSPETIMALESPDVASKAVESPVIRAMVKYDGGRYRGRLMSKTEALKQGKDIGGDFDDAPFLPPWMYGGRLMPDQAAQELFEQGVIPDAYPATFWAAVEGAFSSAHKNKEAATAAKTAAKEASVDAKQRADTWAAQQRKEQADKAKGLDRGRLIQAIRTATAIASALPVEVRGKLRGGVYSKLASLSTDAARVEAIGELTEQINRELERWLKKDIGERIEKLFERAKEKNGPGKKAKGSLGADVHELIWAAEAASAMTADEVNAELARLDVLLDNPDTPQEQEVWLERQRALVELTGDIRNADAAQMQEAYEALNSTLTRGLLDELAAKAAQRERRAAIREALQLATGSDGSRKERTAQKGEAAKWLGKTKGLFLSLSSFNEVLRHAFGPDSKDAIQFVNRERLASAQYEDATESLADGIQSLFTRLAGGSELAGEKLRFKLSQPSLTDLRDGKLSELEAITALLMWEQEDGQRHMEGPKDENGLPSGAWHYDQGFVDDLAGKLSPEARAVMAFIQSTYAGEWETLNPLYRRRHGINLPHHVNYSPLSVKPQQAKAGEMIDPVSGAAVSGSILTPGSLRARNRSAVAEPDFKDSLAMLIGHTKQMEHWKAYYDLAVDLQAVLGNRDVSNAVEGKAGNATTLVLRKWIDAIAQGGMRDAAAGLETTATLQRLTNRAATVGLLGRISTLLVQSTQLGAAVVQIPTTAYVARLSKLLSGNLAWGDAINSPFIQRRYKQASPIVRQAMAELGVENKPNAIKHQVRNLGKLLSGADAMFTAGTYAIILDYQRGNAAKMGLTGAEAEGFAHAEAARLTEEVAQPTRMANRSLAEITATNPLARVMWAYASESRQKLALAAWAALDIKGNPKRAAKTAFLTFIVGGLLSQVLKNLWREAKGDDDESKWSVERLTYASLAGPLGGIPGMNAMLEDGNMLSGLQRSKGAGKRLLTGEHKDAMEILRDTETLLSAAGLFSDTAAALAALSHTGVDAAKVLENLVKDD